MLRVGFKDPNDAFTQACDKRVDLVGAKLGGNDFRRPKRQILPVC